MSLPYAEFYYPLNVFMHILTHEEGVVPYLHYALFADPHESIGAAQEHSTELLLERLPSPPASILEAGIGLATTLARLVSMGYDAEGLTPDEKQIAMVRARHGERPHVHHSPFETFDSDRTFDVVVFQESSQYIDSEALFRRAAGLTSRVIVLDEFALRPLDTPGLHSLSGFLESAARHGFSVSEELDLSARAAPTIQYFIDRIPRYREQLIADLGITSAQVDELIVSGENYVARYADGTYGYRLLQFVAQAGEKEMPDKVASLVRDLAGLQATELHDRLRVEVENLSLAERFDLLHRLGIYHHPESYSGAAATLEETSVLREALPRLVEQNGVETMLDIPCGDFHWMQQVAIKVDYTGADVVPELVAENQKNHGGERRRFVVLDVTRSPLPTVDLIFCRDLLIHLSIADCWAALANFVASGSRFLLTSHFASRATNDEIVSGDFRPVNLCSPPFLLPPPLQVINEASALGDGAFTDRSMALWALPDIADAVSRRGLSD